MRASIMNSAFQSLIGLGRRFLYSAVAWMWAISVLRLANFLIVLPVALRSTSADVMGLWYLMLNLVGGVTLIELGMTAVLSRETTYFLAGSPAKPGANYAAIHGLLLKAEHLYYYLALITAFLCLAGLAWLVHTHQESMLLPIPLIAFSMMALTTVIRMKGLYWNPILYGLQRVQDSQRIQFTGIFLSYLITLAGLWMGAGILALAVGQCVGMLYPAIHSRTLVRKLFPGIFSTKPETVVWRPLLNASWRTGLILLGTWLGTQGLIIACGQTNSLEAAASFSICWMIAISIHSLSQSWLLARYPTISALWSEGNHSQLVSLAFDRISLALGSYVAGAFLAWISVPFLLAAMGSKTTALQEYQLAALFFIVGLDLFISCHSSILIACNRFPHLWVMLAAGALTLCAALILGKQYGLWGLLAAPFVCQILTTAWIVPVQCWKMICQDSRNASVR